jgi:hypothetical protein
MKEFAGIVTLLLSFWLVVEPVTADLAEFNRMQTGYLTRKQQLDEQYENARLGLNSKYALALDRLYNGYRKQGQLDLVLQVKRRIDAFTGDENLKELSIDEQAPALAKIQRQFRDEAGRAWRHHDGVLAELDDAYGDVLERIMQALTRQNLLHEAVLVREELVRLRRVKGDRVPSRSARDPEAAVFKFSFDAGSAVEGFIGEGDSTVRATAAGAVGVVDGFIGNGVSFGDDDAVLQLADETGQYPHQNFTFGTWFLRNAQGDRRGAGTLLDVNYSDSRVAELCGGIRVHFSSAPVKQGKPIIVFYTEGEAGTAPVRNEVEGPVLEPGVWYSLSAVRREEKTELFINGSLAASVKTATGPVRYDSRSYDDDTVLLGGWRRKGFDGAGTYFDGVLDEVVLFDRALSAEAIKASYDRAVAEYEQATTDPASQ